jgi:hypothetical protein
MEQHMQLILKLDWVSIFASIVATLSLCASVFSALGAAKSADIAKSAEERLIVGERNGAIRELMRTSVQIELETSSVTRALENASRSAIATAECYGTPDGKMQFLKAHAGLQEKLTQAAERGSHGISVELALGQTDEWIAITQVKLDKVLSTVVGEKEWATLRLEQLTYANRKIADDITASERSRNIYIRQNHEGKII